MELEKQHRLIARQPILDQHRNIFGFELLYRSSGQNFFSPDSSGDEATWEMVEGLLMNINLNELTGGKPVLINIPTNCLNESLLELLSPDNVILELLETVRPDPKILETIRTLKKRGFSFALDDYCGEPGKEPLLDLIDILKVDFRGTDITRRKEIFSLLRLSPIRFLAEKLETKSEFQEALDLGCTLFQGYYFSKPTMLTHPEIKGSKLIYMQLLQESNKPEVDFDKIENILKKDLAFSYKMLRYINSPYFGLRNKISSIRQAIVLLGEREIRRWVSLLALGKLTEDQPDFIFLQTLTRARFCELLSLISGERTLAPTAFITGMISLIDIVLGQELETLLDELPLEPLVKDTLVGGDGPLRGSLDLVIAWEQADWETVSNLTRKLGLSETAVSSAYIQAVTWSEEFVTVQKIDENVSTKG